MEAITQGDKDEILPGPIRVALSPQGVEEFLARNQKPKKFKFFDTSEQYGMELPSMSSKVLQRMAMSGTINRIEHQVSNYAAQRTTVMKLTKFFGYAILYRRFESRLRELFLNSDITDQWNRQYPKLPVNKTTISSSPTFKALVAKSQESILGLKQEALTTLGAALEKETKKTPEERRQILLQTIRYLNATDPVFWLVLAHSPNPVSRNRMMKETVNLLETYIERSELPDYLSLMLAELIVIVGRVVSSGPDGHDPVVTSFELGTMNKALEEKLRVRISVGNLKGGFDSIRTRMEAQASNKGKSLDQYFSEGTNPDLGMMYLTFIQETCKKMDIFYDSFVTQMPGSRQTMVTINLTI